MTGATSAVFSAAAAMAGSGVSKLGSPFTAGVVSVRGAAVSVAGTSGWLVAVVGAGAASVGSAAVSSRRSDMVFNMSADACEW